MIKSALIALVMTLLARMLYDPMITNDVSEEYDFIVVGGGASGAVVARELSDKTGMTVLLLEAGDSDWSNPLVPSPTMFDMLQESPANWNYDIAKQKYSLLEMGENAKYPGGKILGGSTSINAMNYLRGSPHDYDSWEDHGAKGWSWKDVEPIFKKNENAVDENISVKAGRGGLLNISISYQHPFSVKLKTAAKEIGVEEVDYFDEIEGISPLVCTKHKGIRQSSSDAFLRTGYKEREEYLHIVTNALVSKIHFVTGAKSKQKATGVSYIKNGKINTVEARREIILSAGTIRTPQLLMLSGIGPKNHLEEMKIEVVEDLPGVGVNLQDHLEILVFHAIDDHQYATQSTMESIMEYIMNGTGYNSAVWGSGVVLHHKTKYFGTNVSLSTKKRPFPSIQEIFTPKDAPFPFKTKENYRFNTALLLGVQHPKSKGEIRLKSKNPFDQPIIDPNYLSEEDDIKMYIEGFRKLEEFEMSQTMNEIGFRLITPEICNGSLYTKPPRPDEFYRCYVKSYGVGYHACCTAKIGKENDEMAVVDERLRVRYVESLRVADASVMPHETSSNTQAPCYMIGRKASEMIKQDWNI
uniref:L-sorbose 1-dehydrogenase-like isoform X2 n=1 Tax=Styela clava TaxID=7725 RepID=UPI0019399CB0|nr:L-sorbose 1-dehydrogenase-like isoform X2 [Styela clava]